MAGKIRFIVVFFLLIFLIPFAITLIFSGVGINSVGIGDIIEKYRDNSESGEKGNIGKDSFLKGENISDVSYDEAGHITYVEVKYPGGSEKILFDEYIAGIIAPAYDYCTDEEFLKTMAILCRTYIYYCEQSLQSDSAVDNASNNNQKSDNNQKSELPDFVFYDDNKLKEYWGNDWESIKQQVVAAVEATKGQFITCAGKVIMPYIHEVSSGCTRGELAANSEYSDLERTQATEYLESVQRLEDSMADNYAGSVVFTNADFVKKIKSIDPETIIDEREPVSQIQIVDKTEGGYVKKLQVGNLMLEGESFAHFLGLASPSFVVQADDDSGTVTFMTKGVGDGYGVSIYGASVMARAGSSYKEICNYFFKNIEYKN